MAPASRGRCTITPEAPRNLESVCLWRGHLAPDRADRYPDERVLVFEHIGRAPALFRER